MIGDCEDFYQGARPNVPEEEDQEEDPMNQFINQMDIGSMLEKYDASIIVEKYDEKYDIPVV